MNEIEKLIVSDKMLCYECQKKEASVKIGTANGNILAGFFNGKVWDKEEKYYCRKCYEKLISKIEHNKNREGIIE